MNPFLSSEFHVRWSTLRADAVEPDIRLALERAAETIARICDQDHGLVTYDSTFLALEKSTEELGRGWGRLHHLDSVADHPAQREALNRMLPEVTEFYASIPLNTRLWEVLKAYGESADARKLDPVRRRFVDETMDDFRQAGADLPAHQKERISEIESDLSKLTKQYDHIQDVNDLPELLKAQIQHFFERFKELEAGKWVKVEGWGDKAAAEAEIKTSAERYAAK